VRPALLIIALTACGGASAPAPSPEAAPVVIATPPLASDDVAVAQVNGRAVWASCVATQAARIHTDDARKAALDQCIAFELLAQAAEARGLAAAPEVIDATRTARVNRLVETQFEHRFRTVADLGPAVQPIIEKNAWRMHLIQLRASTFARFVVPDHAPAEVDAKAHALADQLAAQFTGHAGWYGVHLTDAAKQLDAGTGIKLDYADVKPMHQDNLVPEYAKALYAIPEVGQTSAATRTQWGWDVILWTGGIEPKDITRQELEAQMFPDLLRHQFLLWSNDIGKQLGVHIELDDQNVAKLDRDAGGPP
jgi:hypothetical protein